MNRIPLALAATAILATPLHAQSGDDRPRRTRVSLGPALSPSYPGADGTRLGPLIDVSRARGDDPFAFVAGDESFGPALIRADGFSAGPSIAFEGKRSRSDTDNLLPRVKSSIEAGAFAQYLFGDSFRIRAEGRKGVTGHKGLTADLSADYIARDGDKWLFSLGPRVTLADGKYQHAYFGIAPGAASPGLAAYRPSGGLASVGASATTAFQLTGRWGIYGYARYDRLVDDAGRSPVVRNFGDRDQLQGGVALSYTFGG